MALTKEAMKTQVLLVSEKRIWNPDSEMLNTKYYEGPQARARHPLGFNRLPWLCTLAQNLKPQTLNP